MVCPLMRWTNDPGGDRKQIRLQYAGIGTNYGCHWKSRSASISGSGALALDKTDQKVRCQPCCGAGTEVPQGASVRAAKARTSRDLSGVSAPRTNPSRGRGSNLLHHRRRQRTCHLLSAQAMTAYRIDICFDRHFQRKKRRATSTSPSTRGLLRKQFHQIGRAHV